MLRGRQIIWCCEAANRNESERTDAHTHRGHVKHANERLKQHLWHDRGEQRSKCQLRCYACEAMRVERC